MKKKKRRVAFCGDEPFPWRRARASLLSGAGLPCMPLHKIVRSEQQQQQDALLPSSSSYIYAQRPPPFQTHQRYLASRSRLRCDDSDVARAPQIQQFSLGRAELPAHTHTHANDYGRSNRLARSWLGSRTSLIALPPSRGFDAITITRRKCKGGVTRCDPDLLSQLEVRPFLLLLLYSGFPVWIGIWYARIAAGGGGGGAGSFHPDPFFLFFFSLLLY